MKLLVRFLIILAIISPCYYITKGWFINETIDLNTFWILSYATGCVVFFVCDIVYKIQEGK